MVKHSPHYYFVTITHGNITVIYRSRNKVNGHVAQRKVLADAVTAFGLTYPALVAQSTRSGEVSNQAGEHGVDYNQTVG